MAMLDRFRRRKKTPFEALSDEERMARYVYLLNTLPASVIESAHESAFKDVPLARRQEMFERLRPFMSEEEQKQAAEPQLLARLVRRAEERRTETAAAASASEHERRTTDTTTQLATPALMSDVGVMPIVAYYFVMSSTVHAYFAVGAGSLALAGEPAWVGEMVDPGAGRVDGVGSGYDGGGADGGGYSDGGSGYDGGGFSGFDAGGFGGGFGGGFDGGGGGFG